MSSRVKPAEPAARNGALPAAQPYTTEEILEAILSAQAHIADIIFSPGRKDDVGDVRLGAQNGLEDLLGRVRLGGGQRAVSSRRFGRFDAGGHRLLLKLSFPEYVLMGK